VAPSELLVRVAEVLERLHVPYLVTGSIATIYYGEARFTNDIDVVADLGLRQVEAFVSAFPAPEFYLDDATVRTAIAQRGQFNIIHPESGLKVDVMIPTRDAFNASRFSRGRRVEPTPGRSAIFAAPEDVIIRKLEYFAAGGSDKHLRDIAGVLKILGERVDRIYIDDWAERLGVAEIWREVLKEVT
jgi:hypothetical protein